LILEAGYDINKFDNRNDRPDDGYRVEGDSGDDIADGGKVQIDDLKNKIERYYKESEELHQRKKQKEEMGWDLKF